jgi:hypothetical protein
LASRAGQFGGDDGRGGNASPVQTFQRRQVAGLQAADVSMDGRDGRAP